MENSICKLQAKKGSCQIAKASINILRSHLFKNKWHLIFVARDLSYSITLMTSDMSQFFN